MSRSLRVVNRTQESVVVQSGEVAATPWTRLVGLMGRRDLPRGQGLLLVGESTIHTFGMRIPIDVLWLDAEGCVLRLIEAMPPARIGPLVRGAKNVLELPIGTIAATGTRVGDALNLQIL